MPRIAGSRSGFEWRATEIQEDAAAGLNPCGHQVRADGDLFTGCASVERKRTLSGKQLSQAPVLLDRVFQVLHHHTTHTTTRDVLPDRLGQEAGDVLVILLGHGTQFIPSLLIDFGTDLDSTHDQRLA